MHVEWGLLRERLGAAPFVPELEGAHDTSYFISKSPMSPMSPMGELPLQSPAFGPAIARQSSNYSEGEIEEHMDTDFLNFSYHNLVPLMKRAPADETSSR